ncbi:RES domain-containing protein [Robbsia sp. Bb-Pol-6]|uniref:RES domain-containing protein n=1 Tax=Robbsia betulipollinis TaxID=2981849 RepID=A0ABT3ZT56_9BURK|nr:RES domain-containing protein [Robbsia betulipollinis]MCY0389708.1 RES domain-containing protein [Robbsia betulipollinis]
MFSIPPPDANARFTTISLTPEDVPRWYHVYSTHPHANTATTFSQGWGDTRFAPIEADDGSAIPTYYAASAAECAMLESVLHDIPLDPPGQFDIDRLQSYRIATLSFSGALECVSFHTPHLPALRISRSQLIDSLPAHYARTRAWARAAYRQRPTAQAIAYGSRRHDAHRCVMLFGQRLPVPRFDVIEDRPLALDPGRGEVVTLLRQLGIGLS